MRLELLTIGEERVPVVVLDCSVCGGRITIAERDLKTTQPVTCDVCNQSRHLSYREYITITDRFGATLLGHLLGKYKGTHSS